MTKKDIVDLAPRDVGLYNDVKANTNCTLIAESWGTRFEAKLVSVV